MSASVTMLSSSRVQAASLRSPRTRQLTTRVCASAGKNALITGGNTGIGFETAKALSQKGYTVTLACRDTQRMENAAAELRSLVPGAQVSTTQLDLGDLASVRECGKRLLDSGVSYDVVLNNAGVMATPKMKTKDGYEFQLGINHLGHFKLTNMLLPSLKASNKPVRIINVASAAHLTGKIDFADLMRDKSYQPWEAYGQSKLANVMFTYELAKRLTPADNITVNALHPGVVKTELGRYMVNKENGWWMGPAVAAASVFFKTPEQGAQTSIYLASSPQVDGLTGKYYAESKPVPSSPASYDDAVAKKLWAVSCELTDVPHGRRAAPADAAAARR